MVGVAQDITASRRAEEALRDSSTTLTKMVEEQNVLLEHTRDFVYRHDTNGVFNYLSPAVEQVTGYSVEEWWKHYTTYMTDSPINEKVIEYTEETLRTGKERPPYLVEIAHKDGHPVMLEVGERPYFEEPCVRVSSVWRPFWIIARP
jgi:PAS domain S-box-containing protein